jgi:hypothetical protein
MFNKLYKKYFEVFYIRLKAFFIKFKRFLVFLVGLFKKIKSHSLIMVNFFFFIFKKILEYIFKFSLLALQFFKYIFFLKPRIFLSRKLKDLQEFKLDCLGLWQAIKLSISKGMQIIISFFKFIKKIFFIIIFFDYFLSKLKKEIITWQKIIENFISSIKNFFINLKIFFINPRYEFKLFLSKKLKDLQEFKLDCSGLWQVIKLSVPKEIQNFKGVLKKKREQIVEDFLKEVQEFNKKPIRTFIK